MGFFFNSQAERAVADALGRTIPSNVFSQAALAMGYLLRAEDQETHLYEAYRQFYPKPEEWRRRPKCIVNVFRAVIDAVSLLYRTPPLRKFSDPKVGERFIEQRSFDRIMPNVDRYTRTSGLVLLRPIVKTRAGKKRVEHIIYTSDHVEWRSPPDDPLAPEEYTLTWREGDAVRQQVWTKEGARVLLDGKELPDQYIENEIDELPFTWFANEVPDLQLRGEPAIDLVSACLHINNLLTIGNWTMTNQTAPPLFVTGVKKSEAWTSGPNRRWSGPIGSTANYLAIPVNIDELLAMIDKTWKLFLASWRIPESAIVVEQMDRSGVAIVEEREALADYRENRARAFEQSEQDAIRVQLKIMAEHGLAGAADWQDVPSIDYTPKDRLPSAEEQASMDWQVERGIMTEEERLMRLRPGVDETEARARIDASRAQKQEAGKKVMLDLLAAKDKQKDGAATDPEEDDDEDAEE